MSRFKSDGIVKRCSDCLLILPVENFHKTGASRDGRRSRCKDCQNVLNRVEYGVQKKSSYEKYKPLERCDLDPNMIDAIYY